jgi:hypothetical protein
LLEDTLGRDAQRSALGGAIIAGRAPCASRRNVLFIERQNPFHGIGFNLTGQLLLRDSNEPRPLGNDVFWPEEALAQGHGWSNAIALFNPMRRRSRHSFE